MSKNGTENGFLYVFDNNRQRSVPDDIKSAHEPINLNTSADSQVSWAARFTLTNDANKKGVRLMAPTNPAQESVLIQGDSCWSIHEYAPGRMLLAAKSCILNLKDWQILHIHEAIGYKATFEKMGFFLTLPGFNLEKFPFAVVRGRANIHILNVSNGYMRPLFRCKATSIYGQ